MAAALSLTKKETAMDDEVVTREVPVAKKHGWLSFAVLAVDLASNVAREVADTLDCATTLASQHYMHTLERDEFYEIVGE